MTRRTAKERAAELSQALQDAHNYGFRQGKEADKKEAEEALRARQALIQLINATGQAMQAQSDLLRGLSQTIDNSGVRL